MKRLGNLIILCTACLVGIMLSGCSDQTEDLAMAGIRDMESDAAETHGSRLIAPASYARGVGYGYATQADYCKGATFRIFNLERLDALQTELDYNFVSDDFSPYVEEQIITGDSRSSISMQLAVNGSVDLNYIVADVEITGTYTKNELKTEICSYAMKRTKRIVFVRDLQYKNIIMYYKLTGDSTVFTPAFYRDWKELESYNQKEFLPGEDVQRFINKWGKGFVARSYMGGSLDFLMEIENSCLTQDENIAFAINAYAGLALGLNAEGRERDFQQRTSGHYNLDVTASGGNVQLLTAIITGQTSGDFNLSDWLNSFNIEPDASREDFAMCTMVDIKIASMANLFTDKVRDRFKYILNTGEL